MKKILWLAFVLLVSSGCSITKLVSYSPSILMNGSGVIYARDFEYIPVGKLLYSRKDRPPILLESNQVDTGSGLNLVYAEMDIKDYVTDALLKELNFIGYRLDPSSPTIISGDILEFSCYYLNLTTTTIKVQINFKVMKLLDGKWNNVYTKIHEGFYQNSKWLREDFTLVVNEVLRNCIKNFIEDAQSVKIL